MREVEGERCATVTRGVLILGTSLALTHQLPWLALPAPAIDNGGDHRLVDDLILPRRITDGDFGGWLRDAMAERRVSQRTLAMRTGIDHSTISRLLAGGRSPSLTTAVAIIKVLRPRAGGG